MGTDGRPRAVTSVSRWTVVAEILVILYVNAAFGLWQGLLLAVVLSALYCAIFRRLLHD